MAQAQTLQPGAPRVTLIGRVQSFEKKQTDNGDLFITVLRTPAPDQYSSPGQFELLSSRRLGAEGADISVEATLTGYMRKLKTKAGEAFVKYEHVLRVA